MPILGKPPLGLVAASPCPCPWGLPFLEQHATLGKAGLGVERPHTGMPIDITQCNHWCLLSPHTVMARQRGMRTLQKLCEKQKLKSKFHVGGKGNP